MITAEITKGKELPRLFRAMAPAISAEMKKVTYSRAIKMERSVKQKLNGPVLKVRTNRLRSSVHYEIEDRAGATGATVGTNVIYGRIHEYGGVIVPKVATALKFQVGGQWVTCKKVTMPERSYLRSTLKEMTPEIIEAYRKAVKDTIKTGLKK